MLILGFDADTDKNGVALFDAKHCDVLLVEAVPLYQLNELINEIIKDHGKDRLLARVEIPTRSTAHGSIESMKRLAYAKKWPRSKVEKQAFSIAYNSGMVRNEAEKICKLLASKYILTERVISDDRQNCTTGKLEGATPAELLNYFRDFWVSGSSRSFPSKMNQDAAKKFFGSSLPRMNEEKRDALCLAFPELFFNKFLK